MKGQSTLNVVEVNDSNKKTFERADKEFDIVTGMWDPRHAGPPSYDFYILDERSEEEVIETLKNIWAHTQTK